MKPNEMAMKGLNKYIFYIIEEKIKDKNCKILVLGSGEGLIEYYLLKKGYKNIISVDLFTKFKFKDKCKFIKLDLNLENFSEIIAKEANVKEFDLIISIEVIEHPYSPYNFLKNVNRLLSKNGIFILSTPNVHSAISRADYVITGCPTFYITKPKIGDHVSPLYVNILEHYLDLLKLRIIKYYSYGSLFQYIKSYNIYSVRTIPYLLLLVILSILLMPFMIVNRKYLYGTNNIFIITKR